MLPCTTWPTSSFTCPLTLPCACTLAERARAFCDTQRSPRPFQPQLPPPHTRRRLCTLDADGDYITLATAQEVREAAAAQLGLGRQTAMLHVFLAAAAAAPSADAAAAEAAAAARAHAQADKARRREARWQARHAWRHEGGHVSADAAAAEAVADAADAEAAAAAHAHAHAHADAHADAHGDAHVPHAHAGKPHPGHGCHEGGWKERHAWAAQQGGGGGGCHSKWQQKWERHAGAHPAMLWHLMARKVWGAHRRAQGCGEW